MVVLDGDRSFLRSWGEGLLSTLTVCISIPTIISTSPRTAAVRKCSTEGKVLLTIGVPEEPSPFMSGDPFHRCTHTALSRKGEIYVSDGYGNARVQR